MSRLSWLGTVLVVNAVASCAFKTPADVEFDADPRDAEPVDAIQPDAMPCVADTIVCDDASGYYVECGTDGRPVVEWDCPLGCAAEFEICLDVEPSNNLATYLDQARTDEGVTDVTFSGASSIDTTTGEVINGGASAAVPTALVNGMRVYLFDNLEVQGTLKVTGTLPIVLLANGSVTITGLIDVSADLNSDGPGAVSGAAACHGSGNYPLSNPIGGGGGGGRHDAGANGGNAFAGSAGADAGDAVSNTLGVPLVGGCHGSDARYPVSPTPPFEGGGGGGAIQISSRRAIRVLTNGVIDASGGGGTPTDAGSGGGSGGMVLLEAPQIEIDGAGVVLSTKGGSGSAANAAGDGSDGDTSATPAPGGAVAGFASGGAGGTQIAPPTVGGGGNTTNRHGGGGGGGTGDVRINNAAGTLVVGGGAAIRSTYTAGVITSRGANL